MFFWQLPYVLTEPTRKIQCKKCKKVIFAGWITLKPEGTGAQALCGIQICYITTFYLKGIPRGQGGAQELFSSDLGLFSSL